MDVIGSFGTRDVFVADILSKDGKSWTSRFSFLAINSSRSLVRRLDDAVHAKVNRFGLGEPRD